MNTSQRPSAPLRYSTSQLLELRKKDCVCIERKAKRRLKFFRIYVQHITVITDFFRWPVLRRRELDSCSSKRNGKRISELPIPARVSSRKPRPTVSSHTASPRPRFLSSFPRAPRHSQRPSRFLSFGLLNVRSLHRKVDDVFHIHEDLNLDVLLLTETWHDIDSVCVNRLRTIGLSVSDRPRLRACNDTLSTNHGGVLIMSKPQVYHHRVHLDHSPVSFECLCVRLSSGTSTCLVVLIYRTGPVTALFFNELSDMLDHLSTASSPLIVAGDFNIHIERPDDPNGRTLLDTLASYGLSSRVDFPTHIQGGTLDVVFTRLDLPPISVTSSDPGLSDHCLLTWAVPFVLPPLHYRSVSYRPWSRLDLNEFRRAIISSPLCQPSSWHGLDPNELASLYDSSIFSVLDRLVPVRTAKLRERPSDLWFDPACREAKRAFRRFERRLRRLKDQALTDSAHSASVDLATTSLKSSYQHYRSILRKRRQLFWQTKVSSCSSSRDLWGCINSLMGRGRLPLSDSLTASDFQDYFTQKVSGIRDSTADSSPPSFSSVPNDCVFASFRSVTIHSVTCAIHRLPLKSSNNDPIRTQLLKECADIMSPFISHLFNKSLSTGVFPHSWKHARVAPILKKGRHDPADAKSYRPISNLVVLSKLLERIVSSQLRSHLNDYDLLPCVQSAYRPFHSTESAILKVTSDALLSLDKGNVCLLCSLDLSSAFDTVDHSILLTRLHTSFGLSGVALQWFESFLIDRSQSVFFNSSAPLSPLHCGVPQGSVLGPLLFIMFTSDLARLTAQHGLSIHMFADDILLYGSSSPQTQDVLSSKVSACLDTFLSWFASNRLLLNTEKSNFMWCASKRRSKHMTFNPIRFGNDFVTSVSSLRFLGFQIDNDISFSSQISRTTSTCFSALRQIRSVRRCLPQPLLVSLVNSLVISRLSYCISVLAGTPAAHLRKLKRVLHTSARLIFDSTCLTPASPLLQALQWLPIEARIDFRLALLVSKCRQGAPAYLSRQLVSVSSNPGRSRLRSAASPLLQVPFVRHPTIGGRSFPVAAAKVWNSLPSSLSSNENPAIFKRLLKAHFLSKSFT